MSHSRTIAAFIMFAVFMTSSPVLADLATRAREDAEAAAAPPPRETIGPFSLEELLVRALDVGPQVLIQKQELAAAEARADKARAARHPNFALQGQLVHQTPLVDGLDLDINDLTSAFLGTFPTTTIPTFDANGNAALPLPSPTIDLADAWGLPSDIITLGVRIQQPVFTSGRLRHGIKAAALAAELEGAELTAIGSEVTHTITQVTHGLFAARESAALLDGMAIEMAQLVADVEGLKAQGLVTDVEVLAARASLERIKAQSESAKAKVVASIEGLRQLVGIPEAEIVEVSGSLSELAPPDIPDLESAADAALVCRGEVKARNLQAKMAVEQVYAEAAQLSLRPTVVLSFEGGMRGLAIPIIKTNWMHEWDTYLQAAAVVSVPLYDGGAARADVNVAKAHATQAQIGAILTEEMVRAQVRQAHAELTAAYAQFHYSDAESIARTEAHRVALRRFEEGDLARAEFIEAWLALNQAKAGHLTALMDLHAASLELDWAIGSLANEPSQVRGARCGGSSWTR